MMNNSNWEIGANGVKLLLLLVGLNGKGTNDFENAASESLGRMMMDRYMKFEELNRTQELETKRNEGNQEEKEIREDLFKKLNVEDEDTVSLSMQREAGAEEVEEDSDEGKDVEEDDAEGYVEVEEEDIE